MACEEKKLQVELLEILLEMEELELQRREVQVTAASSDVVTECGSTAPVLLLEIVEGKKTADDLSENCVGVLNDLVTKQAEKKTQRHFVWDMIMPALREAQERYNECLHKLKGGIS